MGLLDGLLSPALTVATNAVASHDQAAMKARLDERNRQIQALLMQHKLAGEDATTGLANARTADLTRKAGVPLFGTPEYNNAKAGEASAVEGAKAPIDVQKSVDIAKGTEPIEVKKAGDVAAATLGSKKDLATYESGLTEGREGRLLDKRVAAERAGPAVGQRAASAFATQNKPFVDRVANYMQVKDAIREARMGNPAALKSALLSFAAVADPKAQLRQGVMKEVMQVDPSVAGKFELAVDRLASGKLPPSALDNMERLVDNMHRTTASMYEQRRKAAIARIPSSDAYIPRTEELFNLPGDGSQAPSGQQPSWAKYGVTPSKP